MGVVHDLLGENEAKSRPVFVTDLEKCQTFRHCKELAGQELRSNHIRCMILWSSSTGLAVARRWTYRFTVIKERLHHIMQSLAECNTDPQECLAYLEFSKI